MLIKHSTPKGRNIHIQRLQSKVHSSLLTKWGIDTSEYHCHEAAHRNKKDDGYIAEVFTGDATLGNIDYKEVYWNDSLKAISFFTIGDRSEFSEGEHSLPVSLVFFCDVAALKPTLAHRADEEVRQDVITIFGKGIYGFQYLGYETGLDNVLREYPGSRRNEGLKAVDMQPRHCFRVNFNLIYQANKNC